MGKPKVRNKQVQVYQVPAPMGGYAFPSREDSEAETLINFDFLRDGRLATRLGCTKLNTNSMGI